MFNRVCTYSTSSDNANPYTLSLWPDTNETLRGDGIGREHKRPRERHLFLDLWQQ